MFKLPILPIKAKALVSQARPAIAFFRSEVAAPQAHHPRKFQGAAISSSTRPTSSKRTEAILMILNNNKEDSGQVLLE